VTQPPFFLRQYRGRFQSLYGLPLLVDFAIWHPQKYPQGFLIQVKYQETSGSVDEKFPFLVLSLLQTGIPTLLLLLGDGAKREAIAWCLAQQTPGGLTVMTQWETFIEALNRGML